MNAGAFVFTPSFLSDQEIDEAAARALSLQEQRTSVHAAGKYADLRWYQAPLDPDWQLSKKLLDALGVEKAEMLVFYYLEPDAHLHPHRDLTGATLNDRIRFHIPIITNPGVLFRVAGDQIVMKPGDLWCLDTSYKHSVSNNGSATRVHIVLECKVTPVMRAQIPNGLKAKVHSGFYLSLLGYKFVESLLINSFRDPAFFKDQMKMIWNFVGWRFLGREKVL